MIMVKSKIDFIIDLLNNRKLSVKAKEQVFNLASIEIKDAEITNKKVWEEIDSIKKEIIQLALERVDDVEKLLPTIIESTKSVEHHPKYVAELMSLFNNRKGLKYLTHDYDEEGIFIVKDFLQFSKEIFIQATSKSLAYGIPNSLYAVINQFAFAKQPNWTDVTNEKINTGWSTDEWADWTLKNNNLHPIISEDFCQVISSFKKLTRIVSPDLDEIIKTLVKKDFGDKINNFNFVYENLEKADFYTLVPNLKRALTGIFKEMKLHTGDIVIEYGRGNEDGYFTRILNITQKGSFPTKALGDLQAEWITDKGGMGGIRNNLFGYCNWTVETLVDKQPHRFNILTDLDIPEVEIIAKETVTGFKHILKFYYK